MTDPSMRPLTKFEIGILRDVYRAAMTSTNISMTDYRLGRAKFIIDELEAESFEGTRAADPYHCSSCGVLNWKQHAEECKA